VSIAGLFVFEFDDPAAAVLSVSAGLATVALLLVAVAIAVKSERLRSAGRWIWSKAILAVPITTVAYLAPLVAVAIAFPGTWAIEVIIAAALSLAVVIGFALALLIGVGTFPALVFLGRGEVDPDAVLTELRSRGIDDGAGSRTREPSWATRRIVDLFLSKSLLRKWARTKMSEIGNSATPPMFKSFVRAALVDDGKKLELSCYGVTGWEEHDSQVPREDCVRIDLS
jgi:hypothetical protein